MEANRARPRPTGPGTGSERARTPTISTVGGPEEAKQRHPGRPKAGRQSGPRPGPPETKATPRPAPQATRTRPGTSQGAPRPATPEKTTRRTAGGTPQAKRPRGPGAGPPHHAWPRRICWVCCKLCTAFSVGAFDSARLPSWVSRRASCSSELYGCAR